MNVLNHEAKHIDLKKYQAENAYVHFIGCGGAGTHPLMKIFHESGFRVSGSDLIVNDAVMNLKKHGMRVETGHHKENLPPDDGSLLLLIHTSAATADNPEIIEAKKRNALCLRRGEALGMMSDIFNRVISVSGSHGKTSISSMLAFALHELGARPGCLIGGAIRSWEHNGEAGDGEFFVAEVDESDGTHAYMRSELGIVPNVEDDHSWSVGGTDKLMENFRKYAENTEHLLYIASPETDKLFAEHPNKIRLVFDIETDPAIKLFDCNTLASWGRFQKLNALLALQALEYLGFGREKSATVLSRFPGVERRMSLRYDGQKYRVIEDYAHHPTELSASLEALRSTNPGRRLIIIFQPHRYARLERYFDAFATLLRQAEKVFITPVFAAWTAKGEKDSVALAKAIGNNAEYLEGPWNEIAEKVLIQTQTNDLIAVIGAGDLKEILPFLLQDNSRL